MNTLDDQQRESFASELKRACEFFDIVVSSQPIDRLLEYLALFIKWNKAYNLSAIREPREMLSKHLIDSLSIVSYLANEPEQRRLLDVGTGGGLPGIVLAIVFPDREFTLLDSAGKKMRFLFQVKQALTLENVTIENRRVESYRPDDLFDGVVSRAFASLQNMTSCCHHLLREGGNFWAMKGLSPDDELRELEKHYIVDACHKIALPQDIGERCLVVLKTDQSQ